MYDDMCKKKILVTGAGNGIGKALCYKLIAAGADVIAIARSNEQLVKLKAELPTIQTIQLDLQNWSEVRTKLNDNSILPLIDGLVNNAGVAIIKSFDLLTEQDFDNTFDVNIKAIFNVTQCLLPKLKDGSSIIMVSSSASIHSFDGHSIYSATKAALDSLTRSLALELRTRHIRVNSVNPTVVMTRMGRENWSDTNKSQPLLNRIPLGRFCEVHEVIDAIIYLLSNKSSFINGHHLKLEGGFSVS